MFTTPVVFVAEKVRPVKLGDQHHGFVAQRWTVTAEPGAVSGGTGSGGATDGGRLYNSMSAVGRMESIVYPELHSAATVGVSVCDEAARHRQKDSEVVQQH